MGLSKLVSSENKSDKSTPVWGLRAGSNQSMSCIFPASTARKFKSIVGIGNQGAQTESFKPDLVASYTIRILSITLVSPTVFHVFGTGK